MDDENLHSSRKSTTEPTWPVATLGLVGLEAGKTE
jgi:hypothetical protein